MFESAVPAAEGGATQIQPGQQKLHEPRRAAERGWRFWRLGLGFRVRALVQQGFILLAPGLHRPIAPLPAKVKLFQVHPRPQVPQTQALHPKPINPKPPQPQTLHPKP